MLSNSELSKKYGRLLTKLGQDRDVQSVILLLLLSVSQCREVSDSNPNSAVLFSAVFPLEILCRALFVCLSQPWLPPRKSILPWVTQRVQRNTSWER